MKAADLWIRSGLAWLVIAMMYGTYLGITEQFNLMSSHAHTALLGGVWSVLFSWLLARSGDRRLTRGLKIHWAAYNLGVLAMVAGFALFAAGDAGAIAVMAPGILLVLGATLWIAVATWPRVT